MMGVRAAALVTAAILLCVPALCEDEGVEPGLRAPDFALLSVGGQTVRISSFRGKPVVLTFWAFWCDTWREVRVGYRALADAGVPAELIAVAIDPTREELLADAADGAPAPFYPVLIDRTREVAERYQIDKVPTVLVLDAKGRIRYRHSGWPGTRPIVEAITRLTR